MNYIKYICTGTENVCQLAFIWILTVQNFIHRLSYSKLEHCVTRVKGQQAEILKPEELLLLAGLNEILRWTLTCIASKCKTTKFGQIYESFP